MRKKKVLLTNDDGYDAPGIRLLYEILRERYVIVIVAPCCEQSGVGHSFTYQAPLCYEKISGGFAESLYSVNGSPADCVKFGISYLMDERPDMVISGLNYGENSGISSFYSGTVAAAREGAFWSVPSFAFSLCAEGNEHGADYIKTVPGIIDGIMDESTGCDSGTFFNVNFPSCPKNSAKGIRITRQSMAFFNDRYTRIECSGHEVVKNAFSIEGEKEGIESSEEFDSRALLHGWITITPHSFDSTAYGDLRKLKNIEHTFSFKDKSNE